jgi:hypothetical protein
LFPCYGISIVFVKEVDELLRLSPNGGDCAARGGFYILVYSYKTSLPLKIRFPYMNNAIPSLNKDDLIYLLSRACYYNHTFYFRTEQRVEDGKQI